MVKASKLVQMKLIALLSYLVFQFVVLYRLNACNILGDLTTVIETKENAVKTNQESALLLDGWPRTIAKTIATATRFMRFS